MRLSKRAIQGRVLVFGDNNNNDLIANYNYNNNWRFAGMTSVLTRNNHMKTYNNLWYELCSIENLKKAFKKARKRKTYKPYVVVFEKDLDNNLLQLRYELIFYAYRPKPLKTFVIKDPKTRVISKSDFRDRIIHHAICNIIGPIFEKSFIYDSYANRKNKGTLKAMQRFECFKSKNKIIELD